MKNRKKSPAKRVPRNTTEDNEENIFNPFSPFWRYLRAATRGWGKSPKHPFRDTFITVFLLHLIGVLGLMAHGAIKNSINRPANTKQAQRHENSRVAKILEAKTDEVSAAAPVKPGTVVHAVRDPDPFRTRTPEITPSRVATGTVAKRQNPEEEPLPPVVTASRATPALSPSPRVREDSDRTDTVKRTFLEATGRISPEIGREQSEALATMITKENIEVRRAEPVVIGHVSSPVTRMTHGAKEYVVNSGDNAYLISSRLGVSYAQLAEANNLSSPRDLRVGQRLIVPQGHAYDPM
jgi:hypothetical protein